MTTQPSAIKPGQNSSSLKSDSSSTFDNSVSNNSGGLSRSHSYHSGVTAPSYDLNNNSNVYVDVYMPPPLAQMPPQQQLHLPHGYFLSSYLILNSIFIYLSFI